VLPKEVIIRDLVGNVVQGMTGVPYNEGDKVALFCDVTGGKLALIGLHVIYDLDTDEVILIEHDNYDYFSIESLNSEPK